MTVTQNHVKHILRTHGRRLINNGFMSQEDAGDWLGNIPLPAQTRNRLKKIIAQTVNGETDRWPDEEAKKEKDFQSQNGLSIVFRLMDDENETMQELSLQDLLKGGENEGYQPLSTTARR
jgi:hypothetical protein